MGDEIIGMNTRDQITLKVFIEATKLRKAFRFSVDSTVHEVLVDIRNKTHGQSAGDYKFGLFLPPNRETGAKGFWLQENRKIRFYGFSMETEVEYKTKERPLKVKLIDERILTVKIDDSLTAREICNIVAEKLNIKGSDEFSLSKPTPEGLTKARPWLSDDMTLHEQDVSPDDILEFAKRYFFNDDFVDPEDPYTLHLLYVGANKAIIDGTYPVKADEAVELAGYSVQITYGDHNPKTHIPGFLDPMMFVPRIHRKEWKKLERLILKQHEKCFRMKETVAKFRYIQKVRALDTYGITFFECQECIEKKGRQKWKPVLIGITKDKIMKVDFETQELHGEWTWTQIARWSSKADTFLFDFGDYAKEYLTIRSTETEALNSLVTGYIELILKNLQDVAADGGDSSLEIAEIEEITGDFDFAQAGATATYNHPYFQGGLGQMLWDPSRFGNIDAGQAGPWAESSPAMMTNANDMGSALKASKMLADELGTQKGKWGNKGAVKESDWNKHFEASNSAMASRMEDILNTVALGAGGKLNRQQLDMKSQDLVVQMMNMTTAARALAAYNDDKSALLDGAKAVADCVSDLMQLLNSSCDDPLGAEALKEALEACKIMFANSEMLLHDPSLISYIDKGAELLMLKCVEDVDRSLQGLTNIVSRGIEDLPKQQQNVLMIDVNKVNAVRGIAISSLAQLVPYSLNPTILDKIQISSKTLQVLSTSTLNSAIAMVPSVYHNQLESGAKRVTDALQNLMMASKTAELKATADVDLSTPLKKVLLQTVTMKNNVDDQNILRECLSEIKELDVPINKSFTALQKITPKQNKNMLDTAYVDMIAAEKVIMEVPKLNVGLIENFTSAINVLDKASQSGTALNQLRTATKVLLASLMSLGTDIHLISPNIDDQNQVTILIEYSTNVQGGIPKIINALQNSSLDPQNIAKALELVSLVKTQLPMQSQLSTEAKRTARDIADLNERQKLDMSAGDVQRHLQDLVAAAKLVSDIAGLTEVDKAMGGFDLIHAQLEQMKSEIESGQLVPVQRQSKENANAMLKGGLKSIDISLAEMNAVNKGAAGLVAPIRSILTGLSQCVASTLPLIASTPNKAQHDRLYDLANNLYDVVFEVAAAAKFNQIEKDNLKRLEARDASVIACKELLAQVLAEAESMNNQEYDQIIDSIEKAKKALNRNEVAQNNASFAQASAALPIAGKPIKANCMQIATALKLDPISAPRYNTVLGENVVNLLQLSSVAASAISDVSTANSILDVARSLADLSKDYIIKAHNVQKSPTAEGFQDLADAEAKVNECLQRFNIGGSGTTSEDCKKANDKIAALLDNVNNMEAEASSTADLRQEFISSTKDVANLLGALVSTSRAGNAIDNGLVAKETAGALYHVLAAAKSAKVSDGTRDPYSLDAVRICKGMNEIIESDDPKASLQAAKKATNNCANLVAQAKQIAKIEKDHETRAQLLASAQALVDSTTDLSEAAKTAANKRTPLSIQNLSKVAAEVKANAKKVDDIIRKVKGIQPEAVNSAAADELLNIACEISRSMADVIEKAGAVASNSNDHTASENLVAATNVANEKFALAMNICAKINPGLIQCENTIENIKQLSNSLGGAQALSKAGKLPSSSSDIKATIQSCQDLIAANKVLVTAAQQSALQLEAAATQVDNSMKQLAKRVVGVAGSITDNYAQQQLLATAKGLTDSEISLLVAIPATTSDNPKSLIQLNQAATQAESELNLLIGQLNVETGFDGMDSSIDTILASLRDINKVGSDLGANQDYDLSYMELLQASQDLAAALGGLVNADKKNQQAVMNGISQLTATMPKLVSAIRNLSANAPQELRTALQNNLKTIGDTSVALIGTVNAICRGNEGEVSTLKAQYADISNAIASMLAAAKSGAVGDQLITKAIRDLKEVSNDVNKGRMYSEANVMPIDKSVTISELQKQAFKELKSIKELVGEFPQIINHSNTELLGNTSNSLAELEKNSIDPILKTIARIADKQVQASSLVALKDLVDQSRELVEQSREAVRGNYKSKERVGVLVSLMQADTLKFIEEVKNSSSQTVKGEKELDTFKKAIRDLIANSTGNDNATPKDVIESAREVFQLTSDLVFADNTDAAIATARVVVTAIGNLLNNCRGVANSCDEKIGEGLIDSSQFVAKAMIKMLEVSKYDKQDPETKGKLEEAASTITTGIDEVVRVLRMIPEARSLTLHGADLNFIAQESLAETIKIVKDQGAEMQSSKKLTRTKKGGELDQTDINNALFDAGYAIAAATSAVVGVGAQIQKNRTAALADLTKKAIKTDPTALSALIGSSKETATAITNLSKATKASSYKLDEKQLVASANGVTLATSHMVSALKAGATEQEAETVAKLIQFNEAVVEATSALMSAVHRASSFNDVVEVADTPDTGKVKELEIQIRILKLEKAIKREQRKLEAMKTAQKTA